MIRNAIFQTKKFSSLIFLIAIAVSAGCGNSNTNEIPSLGDSTAGTQGDGGTSALCNEWQCNDNLDCTEDICDKGRCLNNLKAGFCVINNHCVATGTAYSDLTPCQVCKPEVNALAWTDDDSLCPADDIVCTTAKCIVGVCGQEVAPGACVVGKDCFATDGLNPQNSCQVCNPAVSKNSFSNKSNGAMCPDDGFTCTDDVCESGVCQHKIKTNTCTINDTCYDALARHPVDICKGCDPTQSITLWSKLDNVSCTDDKLDCTQDTCIDGLCQHLLIANTCLIDGACYAAGQKNPLNDCQICQPANATYAWTPLSNVSCADDGESCTSEICQLGVCQHIFNSALDLCYIDGKCYSNNQKNPTNSCQVCITSTSKSTWLAYPDGAICADDGLNCTSDSCAKGACLHKAVNGYCAIDGQCYTNNAVATANGCGICDTSLASDRASPIDGAPCNDSNSSTVLDFCLNLTCKGFSKYTLNAPSNILNVGYVKSQGNFWAVGDFSTMQLNGANAPAQTQTIAYPAYIIHHDFAAAADGKYYIWNNALGTWIAGTDCAGATGAPVSLWGTDLASEKVAYVIYNLSIYRIVTSGSGTAATCSLNKTYTVPAASNISTSCYGSGTCYRAPTTLTYTGYVEGLTGIYDGTQINAIWNHVRIVPSYVGTYYTYCYYNPATWNCDVKTASLNATSTFYKNDGMSTTWTSQGTTNSDIGVIDMNALSATDVWAAQTKSNLYSSNGSSWTALSSGNNVTYKGSYPTSSVILMIGQQVNAGNKELVLVTYNRKYQKWYSPIVGYSTTDGTSTSPNFRFNSIAGQNDGQQIHIVGSLVDNLSLTTKGLILYR